MDLDIIIIENSVTALPSEPNDDVIRSAYLIIPVKKSMNPFALPDVTKLFVKSVTEFLNLLSEPSQELADFSASSAAEFAPLA